MCVRQTETTLFWQMSNELRFAVADGRGQDVIGDLCEEIGGVMLNTDNDLLRRRCAEMLRTTACAADFGVA
jgi:hypothetical protein